MTHTPIKIQRDKNGNEFQVSIRSAWPDLLMVDRRGKKRGFRSKLKGDRELECRVFAPVSKRNDNKIAKIREQIKQAKQLRGRLNFVISNPELKAGRVFQDGTVQPRANGKFLKKVRVA